MRLIFLKLALILVVLMTMPGCRLWSGIADEEYERYRNVPPYEPGKGGVI